MTSSSCLESWKRLPLFLSAGLFAAYLIAIKFTITSIWLGPLLAAGCLAFMLVRLSLKKDTIIILTLGMLAYWWWLEHSDFRFCTADLDGHIAYMAYIANHFTVPLPHEGLLFYHPPLYYLITGLIHAICTAIHCPLMPMLRLFSLGCFLTFLLYGELTLQLANLPHWLYRLCLLLIVLWPSGIVIATRINSDLLVYPLCMASFYHLLTWHQGAQPQEFRKSLFYLGFALMTRSNAIVLIPVIAIIAGYHFLIHRQAISALWNKRLLPCAIFLILALSINFGRNIYEHVAYGIDNSLIIGNGHFMTTIRQIKVGNSAANLLTFDYKHYLSPPFADIFNDATGRQNFGSTFFKSMLWCLCFYSHAALAVIANICLLATLGYIVVPLYRYRSSQWVQGLPHILLFFVSIAALWYNRYDIPVTSSGEWRYCYFALVPAIILWGYHVEELKQQHRTTLYRLAIATALALILCGDAVYLLQF